MKLCEPLWPANCYCLGQTRKGKELPVYEQHSVCQFGSRGEWNTEVLNKPTPRRRHQRRPPLPPPRTTEALNAERIYAIRLTSREQPRSLLRRQRSSMVTVTAGTAEGTRYSPGPSAGTGARRKSVCEEESCRWSCRTAPARAPAIIVIRIHSGGQISAKRSSRASRSVLMTSSPGRRSDPRY